MWFESEHTCRFAFTSHSAFTPVNALSQPKVSNFITPHVSDSLASAQGFSILCFRILLNVPHWPQGSIRELEHDQQKQPASGFGFLLQFESQNVQGFVLNSSPFCVDRVARLPRCRWILCSCHKDRQNTQIRQTKEYVLTLSFTSAYAPLLRSSSTLFLSPHIVAS